MRDHIATPMAALPPSPAPRPTLVAELADRLRGRRVVALTGAGVSTESGIPDYRGPASMLQTRRPVHGPDFVRSPELRRRYWARAMVGWERFGSARPGPAHVAIARLGAARVVSAVITQNVDRLHRAAGSPRVVELHGALAEVVCLSCGGRDDRDAVQRRMRESNRAWLDGAASVAPDGDADLADDAIAAFEPPSCRGCGGVLKPCVVFFGENVPKAVVDEAFACLDGAEALLVAGTSLAVFSGYRFLRHAAERGMTIAIVNRGAVRGEEHARIKIEDSTGEVLTELAQRLA